MASLLRSSLKLSCNFSRLSHLQRLPVRSRIGQQICSIFTSNKKKDSAAIPVAEKQVKEVEKSDSLANDEVHNLTWLGVSSVREPVCVSLSKRAREDDGRCWIWLSQFRVSLGFTVMGLGLVLGFRVSVRFILFYIILWFIAYVGIFVCDCLLTCCVESTTIFGTLTLLPVFSRQSENSCNPHGCHQFQ